SSDLQVSNRPNLLRVQDQCPNKPNEPLGREGHALAPLPRLHGDERRAYDLRNSGPPTIWHMIAAKRSKVCSSVSSPSLFWGGSDALTLIAMLSTGPPREIERKHVA